MVDIFKKKGESKVESKVNIEEKLEEGYIYCRNIIEILGKPKEYVEETLNNLLETIEENPDYIIVKKDISNAQEQETMFSQFVEVEILIKGLRKVMDFILDFMPSSVEIVQPEDLLIKADKMNYVFNDMVGTIHNMDMLIKNYAAEKKVLIQNYSTLLHNTVKMAIKGGAKSKEEISKITGIDAKSLEPLLEKLKEKGELTNE
ncbi:hypothetical protein K9M79_08570 [Candidatus Woesearchaeota archaeon]|nr:hypothetical protein [Candidatus Woesearchaeota archaeon]